VVGLHLEPGLADEEFVGAAIGNLAAYPPQQVRGEELLRRVIRIKRSNGHHFRLVT
jgi:hypothetical protein